MGLIDTLYRIKEFLISGLHSLPMILIGVSLVLACSTANTGFAILFVLLALGVPIASSLLNVVAPFIQSGISWFWTNFGDGLPIDWRVPASNVCKAAPIFMGADASTSSYPSLWMAIISFFFGFVFSNGYALFSYESTPDTPEDKVQARKAHAVIGMTISCILFFALVVWRYRTGCEHMSFLGLILSFGLSVSAFFIFQGLNDCGLLRVVDIYGIGGRLLPATATAEPSQVCFPVA